MSGHLLIGFIGLGWGLLRCRTMKPASLFEAARACIEAAEPADKLAATREAAAAWCAGRLAAAGGPPPEPMGQPGLPARLKLVPPQALPRRGAGSRRGRAALVHALCHIEYNAINLAWDAVYRFRGLPRAFYDDWVGVAVEEAHHFSLLAQRLAGLDCAYGDLPGHDGLWQAARETAHDPLVRMALVPRVLEARGLDVTPGIRRRLVAAGDHGTAAVLDVIHRDEVDHVRKGTRWFRYLCRRRGLDPEDTFRTLLEQHLAGHRGGGPLAREARRAAGFTESELSYLEGTGAPVPA